MRCNWHQLFARLTVAYISFAGVLFYFFWVQPSLSDNPRLHIGADSTFYLWIAGLIPHNPNEGELLPMLSASSNFLGPYLIASGLRHNFLIFLFNISLFVLAIHYFAKATPFLKKESFLLLLLLNPVICISILTLSKEILAILSTALLCYWINRRSRWLGAAILLISFLARWESMLAVIIFMFLSRSNSKFSRHRKLTLSLMILSFSVLYPFIPFLAELGAISAALDGNTIATLTEWQSHGLYFIAFFPKLALNLFGGVKQFGAVDSQDIYNAFVAPVGSVFNIAICAWFLLRKRFTLYNDKLFFCAIYAIMFVTGPSVQIRFWLPLYIILCLELCQYSDQTNTELTQQSSPTPA